MKFVKLFILCSMAITTLTGNAQHAEQGLRLGEKAPDFTLKDQNGKEVNLYQLLKKGPVILNWYRGGWCPYCNLELKGLADKAAEIKQLGATLIALSPELPDKSLTTIEKNDIPFTVLSDTDNAVARTYDLVFKLDSETAERYESKLGLSQYNGNDKAELPIPATYIIDQEGIIRYAFINPDYKKRANPNEVVMQLTQLVKVSNNDKLKTLNYEVLPMGEPLANYLKRGYQVITF